MFQLIYKSTVNTIFMEDLFFSKKSQDLFITRLTGHSSSKVKSVNKGNLVKERMPKDLI